MQYDFTTIMDRRGKDAIAVDALGKPGGFAPAPLPCPAQPQASLC